MNEPMVTKHAAQRWQARVKPAMTLDQAWSDLRRMIPLSERKTAAELGPVRETFSGPSDQVYVVLADGIYAPIEVDKWGDEVITSILTNAGMSAIKRKGLNAKKRDRRYGKALRASRRDKIPYKR